VYEGVNMWKCDWEKPEAEFLEEIQTKVLEFSSLLFTVTSIALPSDFYFFKLTHL
jgi:hypothetical protein